MRGSVYGRDPGAARNDLAPSTLHWIGEMTRNIAAPLFLSMLLAGCEQRDHPVAPSSLNPRSTASSGSVSTLLGRGSLSAFNLSRQTGPWTMTAHSYPLDVAVQSIAFSPGGQSGWHKHPGPVFILVVQGTITFYESDDPHCRPIVRSAGQGYLDAGENAHIARNETQHDAQTVVTYFAPPGATLRIDAPVPGNCPF